MIIRRFEIPVHTRYRTVLVITHPLVLAVTRRRTLAVVPRYYVLFPSQRYALTAHPEEQREYFARILRYDTQPRIYDNIPALNGTYSEVVSEEHGEPSYTLVTPDKQAYKPALLPRTTTEDILEKLRPREVEDQHAGQPPPCATCPIRMGKLTDPFTFEPCPLLMLYEHFLVSVERALRTVQRRERRRGAPPPR